MSAHRDSTVFASGTTGVTTCAYPKPGGLAAGDAFIAELHVINNTTAGSWSDIGLPTDAFLLCDANSGGGGFAKGFLWAKVADGSEGATIDATYQDPSGAANTFCVMGVCIARSGHDSSIPFDHGVLESGAATGGSTTTLVRTGAGWTVNAFAGKHVKNLTTGKYAYIASNTSDTLTLRHAMSVSNANGHSYSIISIATAGQFNAPASGSYTAPSVTTNATSGQLVNLWSGDDGNTGTFGDNWSPPGGETERNEVNIDSRGGWGRVMGGDQAYSSAGATGTRVATGASNVNSFGFSVALREQQQSGPPIGHAVF